jgi:hypothetical protein
MRIADRLRVEYTTHMGDNPHKSLAPLGEAARKLMENQEFTLRKFWSPKCIIE